MKDFTKYKKKFREKAEDIGFSEDNIVKCLNYSEKLSNNNLPIIYDSSHLAGLVGYHRSYLTRALISTEFFYRTFKIPKKNGKIRIISEPLPSLKEIQYFILNEILYKQKVSKYCKSYIPKRKFREYLRFHTDEKQVLTLDIKDFFPSIKFNHIHEYFLNLGFAKDVSLYLACLSTYTHKENDFIEFKRFLPQGAPTSPYLSNLILTPFDDKVAEFCFDKKIKFTRYADDMAFSGEYIDQEELLIFIKNELNVYGLELNEEKINFMKQNVPQIISGVIVNKKLQLPKAQRNEIRKVMYFINEFGIDNHLEKTNETREYYLSHLLGRIQYALNLNPDDSAMKEYKNQIIEIKNEQNLKFLIE
ncbi:RNA-directed DNA polymerase [Kaistella sp. G5-32]|uniref:RNA-directed DNA polymerase n=1 Tax=Kaistella gelatinilytica TaxID=2787636 RepID=A0ABS0FAZ8_9FLAO|nr:reverse transcriptase family protein [Kaistella gelatinilytica]MBF8456895.1 RNA-directed DNA polymerase [Kaistella gelatinilytica]